MKCVDVCVAFFIFKKKEKKEIENGIVNQEEERIMLRSTFVARSFRARVEFDRLRSMMRGRAKLERKVGLQRITFLVKQQTRYRVEIESYWRKTVLRKGIDSAAVEHGAGWATLKNDIARQNILLTPTAQNHIAKYEPLAFRALMELCSSRIAPPQPPVPKSVPPEAYIIRTPQGGALETSPLQQASPAATRELREKIKVMLSRPSQRVSQCGLSTVDEWVDSWKQFESVDDTKRLAYRSQ